MAQPKCPSCGARGADYINAAASIQKEGYGDRDIDSIFRIIYCSECGHIHGILPRIINTKPYTIKDDGY